MEAERAYGETGIGIRKRTYGGRTVFFIYIRGEGKTAWPQQGNRSHHSHQGWLFKGKHKGEGGRRVVVGGTTLVTNQWPPMETGRLLKGRGVGKENKRAGNLHEMNSWEKKEQGPPYDTSG